MGDMLINFCNVKKNVKKDYIRKNHLFVNAEYATAANVEIDQQTVFEAGMKLFRREANLSNVVNEMRRRRYHEETWMMRRRKEKERTMKPKFRQIKMTFEDKNPYFVNTTFAQEYGRCDIPLTSEKRGGEILGGKRGFKELEHKKNTTEHDSVLSSAIGQRSYRRTVRINDSATLGRVVGYKGATLKAMEARTETRIVFRTLGKDDFRMIIDGETKKVIAAEELLLKVIQQGPLANELPEGPEKA